MSEQQKEKIVEKPKPVEGSKIIRRTKDEHDVKRPKLTGN